MRVRKAPYTKKPADIDYVIAAFVQQGYTQEEMARKIGVSRPTLSRWMSDCGWVSVTTWVKREDVA